MMARQHWTLGNLTRCTISTIDFVTFRRYSVSQFIYQIRTPFFNISEHLIYGRFRNEECCRPIR